MKYETTPCYGAFAEQWKHDNYTKRKIWFRKYRVALAALSASFCALATIAVFLFVR